MMKKILLFVIAAVSLVSCSQSNRAMQGASTVINFERDDFTYSPQVNATASITKVFGVNWGDLFVKKYGSVSNSIISSNGGIGSDKTMSKATYKLLEANQGYDLVFYPVYEKTKLGFLFGSTTDVTVRARLGKIKD